MGSEMCIRDRHSVEVRQTNNIVCLEGMKYCIDNKYSIILDRSVSNKKDLSTITERVDLPIILIKIISSEDENIKRVKNRQEEKEMVIPHYGHQESKSGVVTEEEYNKIKERKVYDLEDSIYDYFVDTNTSLSNLYEQLTTIKNQIQQKYN